MIHQARMTNILLYLAATSLAYARWVEGGLRRMDSMHAFWSDVSIEQGGNYLQLGEELPHLFRRQYVPAHCRGAVAFFDFVDYF